MPESQTVLQPAAQLAALGSAELTAALRPLWEDATWLAERLHGRSFDSWGELIDVAEAEIDGASDSDRAVLLAAHPRLGENRLRLKSTSSISWAEQGGDRDLEGATSDRLAAFNDRYEARFGFPFVEWVAGRPLAALIPVIEKRMDNDRSTELAIGCAAMVSIARDRLDRLLNDHRVVPS